MKFNGSKEASSVYMSVDEWISVPDNPIQRDTERHVGKALKHHLKQAIQTQSSVHMAVMPNGDRYKLDGHTRSYLWERGLLERPRRLIVLSWPASSIEEVKALYRTFDDSYASEDVHDKLSGILKFNNVKFESSLLRDTKFATALRAAHNFVFSTNEGKGLELEPLVKAWLPELLLLDRVNPSTHNFPTGMAFGAILCFAIDGERALEFWMRYANKDGVKIRSEADSVHHLSEELKKVKKDGKYGGVAIFKLGMLAFLAYESFQKADGGMSPSLRFPSIKKQAAWRESILRAKTRFTLLRNDHFSVAAE